MQQMWLLLVSALFLGEVLLGELAGTSVSVEFVWRNDTFKCFMLLLLIITVLPRRFYNPSEQKSSYYALTKRCNPVMSVCVRNAATVTSFSGKTQNHTACWGRLVTLISQYEIATPVCLSVLRNISIVRAV